MVQREEPAAVGGPAHHGVHLPAAAPLVLGQREERLVGPPLGAARGRARRGAPALLELDLALQHQVGAAAVAAADPVVYGGGAHPDVLVHRGGRLVGRQPPRHRVAHLREGPLGPLRLHVDAGAALRAPQRAQGLGPPGVVDDPAPVARAVAVALRAAVAHPGGPLQPGAPLRVHRLASVLQALVVAVGQHLPGHARGRPAYRRRDRAEALVGPQPLLDPHPLPGAHARPGLTRGCHAPLPSAAPAGCRGLGKGSRPRPRVGTQRNMLR